jgi:DNA-binding response OmpR family regulator
MHILVVEDEVIMLEFLKHAVKKSGHSLDTAKDGAVAIEKIANNTYDVIVLDVILPHFTGYEICEKARDMGITTPIIFLTSQQTAEDKIKGLNIGADDYMVKPFNYAELEARLNALYRRPKQFVEDTIEIRNVSISNKLHKVWVNDTEIDLRNKEFSLLEFLMREPSVVHSREEIFQHVWGVQLGYTSNRVDACVKEIRKKIGNNMIKTVHGSGYTITNDKA